MLINIDTKFAKYLYPSDEEMKKMPRRVLEELKKSDI